MEEVSDQLEDVHPSRVKINIAIKYRSGVKLKTRKSGEGMGV